MPSRTHLSIMDPHHRLHKGDRPESIKYLIGLVITWSFVGKFMTVSLKTPIIKENLPTTHLIKSLIMHREDVLIVVNIITDSLCADTTIA